VREGPGRHGSLEQLADRLPPDAFVDVNPYRIATHYPRSQFVVVPDVQRSQSNLIEPI